MRVDRYLYCIRLAKSRTLAQQLIEDGRVRLNGKRVSKSSEDVGTGAVIALALQGKVRILRVTALPTRRGPATEASRCFEEID